MNERDQYQEISSDELSQWIENRKNFYLIDVLVADHFQKIHLPKALQACVFEVTFIEQMKSITSDKSSKIVLYGSSKRSKDAVTAAGKLSENGFENIYVLTGGLEKWVSDGFPLEGEAVDESIDPQTILHLEDGTYQVDTDKSMVHWTGRNPGTTHYGTIHISSGEFRIQGGIITGQIDVDMNSIVNINLEGDELQPVLVEHLKSDDFFHSYDFPQATLKINKGAPTTEPLLSAQNYKISGDLNLKGMKAQLDFMATITTSAEKDLLLEAHFDFDRTKWGVIYGSTRFFEHLGMHMVFDPISIQIRIVATS